MDNNIAIVLDTLGQKIADLKNDLCYSDMRYKMLEEAHEKLKKDHEGLTHNYDTLLDKLNAACERR